MGMTTRGRLMAAALAASLGLAGAAAAQGLLEREYTVALAAERNDTGLVQTLLLRGGSDPDGVDSATGRTALDYAVSFNNVAMLNLLLDHGAHVNAHDGDGDTALHWAAELGNLSMMKLLIADRAAVDTANHQGITPLMLAASHVRPRAVQLLIASGADPKKQDYTGRDAADWAAGNPSVLQALASKP
jgi:uncharacterized protein